MSAPNAKDLADALVQGDRPVPTRASVRACPAVVDELKRRSHALLGSDAPEALRVARLANRASRSLDDDARAVGAHTLAKAYHANGQYRQAAGCYTRAAAGYTSAGRQNDRARIELALIDVCAHLGRHAEAEAHAERALRALRRLGDDAGAARALTNLANLRHAQDRHRAALRLLARARPLLERTGDAFGLAIIDYNRANSHSQLAQFERSGELYDQARSALELLGQREAIAIVDYNQAYDRFLQGRFQDARELLERARAAFTETDATHRLALTDMDEAELALASNLPQLAATRAATAVASFQELGARLEAARAALFAAEAANQLGDEAGARARALEARRAFRRGHHVAGSAMANLALAGLTSEPASRRLKRALGAAAVLGKHGLRGRETTALAVAGSIALERNDLEQAHDILRRAASRARRHGLAEAELRARHALARTELARGRPRLALRQQRGAIAAYERLRSGIRSDDDRLAFAADKSIVFEDAIKNALELGKIDEAFEFVERARSRALVDLLSIEPTAGKRGTGSEVPAKLAKRLADLKRELTGLDRRARDQERREGAVPAAVARELKRALAEREEAIAHLAERAPEQSYALAGRPTATLDELRATLGDDTALVAYFHIGERIGALLVTDRKVAAWRGLTHRRDVRRALRSLRFALAPRSRRTAQDADRGDAIAPLESLRRQLLGPIEPELGDRRLVTVPPSDLHLVPFHALSRRGQPLLEEREVSLAPSATVLVLANRARTTTNRGRLVIGVPDPVAPKIANEAGAIARVLGTTAVAGTDANASTLRLRGASARVIHIAAHGVYQPDEPLLSGLQLGDGRLTVPEIADLDLDAALVTLSACDTAIGQPQGDEVVGVVRAFLHAGARAVVASLWAAHDSSTAALMETFYGQLAAGAEVGAALRTAQLETRREWAHPYHWAPFIAVGDTRATLE